ncbi:MAG: Ig-like domain-containing protein [Bacteroidia bacterium]
MTKHLLYLSLFFASCASVSAPDGGPRDTTPPKVVSTYPDSAQLNIKPKQITLTFDEYVVAKSIQDLLIISPRIGSSLKTEIKKKTLVIEFDDSLLSNTTYSLQLNGSIADNNEGNELQDYQLSFSTGAYLDSLNYHTLIIDAFTKAACEDCVLYLYESYRDSSVLLDKPVYVARTNGAGYATIPRLSNKSYTAVALRDINKNLSLNLEESVSTSKQRNIQDSMATDTFYVFSYENKTVAKPKLVSHFPGVVRFCFDNAVRTMNTKLLLDNNQIEAHFNLSRDTLLCRFKAAINDSLNLKVQIDTFSFAYTYVPKATKRAKRVKAIAKNKQITFSLPQVVQSVDTSGLIVKLDSIDYHIDSYEIENQDVIIYLPPKKEVSAIQYFISDSCFQDINGSFYKADSGVLIPIAVEGSNLKVELSLSRANSYLIQLLKGTEVVDQRVKTKSEILSYESLGTGNYRIRIIEDANSNLIWDPGNILTNTEAEKVFLSEGIDLRPNWDKELKISY